MTGYNASNVRHVWYGGREYIVLRDGRTRLVWSHTNRSHLHVERGQAR